MVVGLYAAGVAFMNNVAAWMLIVCPSLPLPPPPPLLPLLSIECRLHPDVMST